MIHESTAYITHECYLLAHTFHTLEETTYKYIQMSYYTLIPLVLHNCVQQCLLALGSIITLLDQVRKALADLTNHSPIQPHLTRIAAANPTPKPSPTKRNRMTST
jgi:hypothetical protein